jgi:hypothetical protein
MTVSLECLLQCEDVRMAIYLLKNKNPEFTRLRIINNAIDKLYKYFSQNLKTSGVMCRSDQKSYGVFMSS